MLGKLLARAAGLSQGAATAAAPAASDQRSHWRRCREVEDVSEVIVKSVCGSVFAGGTHPCWQAQTAALAALEE